MKLVTIDAPLGGRIGAQLADGSILDLLRICRPGTLEAWIPPSVKAVLAAGQDGIDAVRRIVDRAEASAGSARDALHD